MQASDNIIDFIKSYEELKRCIYKDGAGINTIGWGHIISDSKLDFFKIILKNSDNLLPMGLCEGLFISDLQVKIDYLNIICKEYNLNLSQNVFDGLLSFLFNVGGFNKAMLDRLKNHNLTLAFDNLLKYVHDVNGNIEKGLVLRRQDEYNIITKNIYKRTYE